MLSASVKVASRARSGRRRNGVLQLDDARVVVAADDAFCRAFACEEGEVLGRSLDDIVCERDRTGAAAYLEGIARGGDIDVVVHVRPGNTEHVARLIWDPEAGEAELEAVTDTGPLARLVALSRQWRAFVRDTQDAVLIIDETGCITEQNGRLVEMLSFDTSHGVAISEDALRSQNLFDVLEGVGFPDDARAAFGAARPRDRGLSGRFRVGEQALLLEMAPILTTTRAFSGCSVVLRDVSAEEELVRIRTTIAHDAGMARVATGVLHNVGNALNSINVSTQLMLHGVTHSRLGGLDKVAQLARSDRASLEGPKLDRLLQYVGQLADRRLEEQREMLASLATLGRAVEHAKAIVAGQQSLSLSRRNVEECDVTELLGFAASLAGLDARAGLETISGVGRCVALERHTVLQILVNLLKNARDACSARPDPRIALRAFLDGPAIVFEVEDNGVGCEMTDAAQMFGGGFTTKPTGHGFGLHESATSASEMRGHLSVVRAAPGQGVTFRLQLPLHPSNETQT